MGKYIIASNTFLVDLIQLWHIVAFLLSSIACWYCCSPVVSSEKFCYLIHQFPLKE